MSIAVFIFLRILFYAILLLFLVVHFRKVQEGSVIIFKYMGGFACCVMQFTNYGFDHNGCIEYDRNNDSQTFGKCWCIKRIRGWVFYLWPFATPAVQFKLHNIVLDLFLEKAETVKPESVALNVRCVAIIKIINPRLFAFVAPPDALKQAAKRIEAILRGWVGSGGQDQVQSAKGNGAKLWKDLEQLGCMPVLEQLLKMWGVEVVRESIVVHDVGYDPEYQYALKAQSEAKLRIAAVIEETSMRVLRAVADYAGLSIEELQEKLKKDPTLRGKSASQGGLKEAFDTAEDQVKRDRAGEKGQLIDIRSELGGDGILAAAMAAILGKKPK